MKTKKWTKKTYSKELKKGYWDLEPHFYYYCQLEFFTLFRTILKEELTTEDFYSLVYGKFVCEGKPIKKGFYNSMNFMTKIINEIIEKNKNET